MPWVKTSDTFIDWPAWEALGTAPHFLHMAALSYCNRSGTDGLITRGRARMLTPVVRDPDRAIDALLEAGVWVEESGQIRVAVYVDDLRSSEGRGDEQPKAAAVKAKRDADKDRLRKWREKRSAQAGNAVTSRVTNGERNSVQTRPDPKGLGLVSGPVGTQPIHLRPECEHGTPGGRDRVNGGHYRCPECRGRVIAE